MSTDPSSQRIWPLPVAVTVALLIFVATFYTYAEERQMHREGPSRALPLIIGLGAFAASMLWLTRLMLPREEKKIVRLSFAIAVAETGVFAYLLMFLLLNLYGS